MAYVGCAALVTGEREIGILLPNNQRQHRALHISDAPPWYQP